MALLSDLCDIGTWGNGRGHDGGAGAMGGVGALGDGSITFQSIEREREMSGSEMSSRLLLPGDRARSELRLEQRDVVDVDHAAREMNVLQLAAEHVTAVILRIGVGKVGAIEQGRIDGGIAKKLKGT